MKLTTSLKKLRDKSLKQHLKTSKCRKLSKHTCRLTPGCKYVKGTKNNYCRNKKLKLTRVEQAIRRVKQSGGGIISSLAQTTKVMLLPLLFMAGQNRLMKRMNRRRIVHKTGKRAHKKVRNARKRTHRLKK